MMGSFLTVTDMKKHHLRHVTLTLLVTAALTACGSSTAKPESTTAATTVAAASAESPVPDSTPAETKPAETKPADSKPPVTKPAEVAASDKGITKEEREAMLASVKSGGAPEDVAICVTDGLAKGLTRDEFNAVTKAKKEEDVPKAVAEKANSIAMECALGSSDASTVAPAAPDTTIAAITQTVGTKAEPVAMKTPTALPNGYEVTVNSFTPAATSAVLAANEFNDKPPAGTQFVLMNVTVTNNGGDTDKRIPAFDLPVKAVSKSGKTYESNGCITVLPDPLNWGTDLFKGSSVTGNLCLIVDDADAAGLTMYIDAFLPDYTSATYYFTLA
jgi:Domain of unknown function (DUF4352)